MRSDGEALYFFVQHWGSSGGPHKSWVASSLDHLLFAGMTFEEKRGAKAGEYRELMKPQSASSDLWQRFGINGFVDEEDAFRALDALKERRPDMRFRVVRRHITQTTEVVQR